MSLKKFLHDLRTKDLTEIADFTIDNKGGELTSEELRKIEIAENRLNLVNSIIKFCEERGRY